MIDKEIRPHSYRFLIEWLFLGAALAASGSFVAYSLFKQHQQIEIGEHERLVTQAKVVNDNLGRRLDSANRALMEIRSELPFWKSQSDGRNRAAKFLKSLSEAMPSVRTLNILDAKGTVINSDKPELIGKDFSQREYFLVALRNPDPDTLYVSPPFKTALGIFTINLVRVILGPDGRFAGIVSATLDPDEFNVLLSSVLYAPDMRAVLIHGDGKVFMTIPGPQDLVGMDLSKPGSFFAQHLKSRQQTSTFTGILRITGDESMSLLQTILPAGLAMDKPLVIGLDRGLKAMYASWHQDVYLQGALFALLTLFSTLGLFFFQRRQRRYEQLAAIRESEQRQNAERMRLATEASGVGVWEYDLASRRTFWDDSMFVIYGKDPAEFSPTAGAWQNSVLPEDIAAGKAILQKSFGDGQTIDAKFRIRRGDGAIRMIMAHGLVHCDEAGKPLKIIGTNADITASVRAEEQLRIAATAFEAQDGILVADVNNVILRVNQAFTQITGYTSEDAVGKTTRLLKSGRHDQAFYARMWETLLSQGSWHGEIWNKRKEGAIYPSWLTITAVKGDTGETTHYVATMTDITARKAAEDEIRHLAFYDSLTHLPNRRLLHDRLQQALASSARNGREGALLFIDLDNFKTLNDTLGHDKGDLLLQQVALRLSTCIREGDTVARLGGDEFVVMLEDLSDKPREAATQSEIVGEKILAALNQFYQLAGHEHYSTPSIGITLFNDHMHSVEELLKRADLAMYQAKAAGRNTLRFFDPEMQAMINGRVALEASLRQGLQEHQFILYYQPQVKEDGAVTGAECLVRWQHPQRGMVFPGEFISLAEETGLILPLGHWVLATACAQLVAWAGRTDTANLSLAVNVSARQFHHPDFVEQVMKLFDQTGADPHKLKLELTESMLVRDIEDIIVKMTALKEIGVGFSLDDFGTGYSSLSYLKRLPLDQLKIDRSFVRDVITDINDGAIAQAVIALGQTMGLSVIAEGVETEEQRDFLFRGGCLAYQGYLFSQPLALQEFEKFLSTN